MITNIIRIFSLPDLRKKLFIVIGLLAVFRLLAAIPIPGTDIEKLRLLLDQNQGLGLFNLFSGGALNNLSIAMLGVGPYITSTIILQLLTMIFPRLKELYYEEGPVGRAKFARLSRYITVPLAALQGYGFLNFLASQGAIAHLGLTAMILNVITITTGSMILLWIGELIDEQKIGNGVSLVIFTGIVSGLPSVIQTGWGQFLAGTLRLDTVAAYVVVAILVIAGVVFMNEGERKIPVSYAKRMRGNKMYGGVSTYLPLRVNQAGVIPIIFAISLLLVPQFLGQLAGAFGASWGTRVAALMNGFSNNLALYGVTYFVLVFVFTYFYTAVIFDPNEIAKNLQRNGGFVPGIRPGAPTAAHLGAVIGRVTLFGAAFLGVIAVLPILTQIITKAPNLTIGGTALLIVVSVALDFARQLGSQLKVREYEF